MHMIDLSIIIPCSRNNTIIDCLKSLFENKLGQIKIEIIVIKLPDVEIDIAKSEILKIKTTNINHPSRMRNIGVKESNGKFLVFLDDDTVIPENWLKTCYQLLTNNPNNIVAVPNIDYSSDWGHSLSNAIQSVYISEGLRMHIVNKLREVDFHNVGLCCALDKKIFKHIGGLNEQVDYYLDDVEFFYICHKLGYKFIQYPELTIQHHCRKFPFDFLKYKFYVRKKIGYNAFFFPELYQGSFAIRLILLSYLAIPLLIYLSFKAPRYWFLIIAFYFSIVIFFSLKTMIKAWRYLLVPLGIFLNHLVSYFGFTCGIIKGLINFKKYKQFNQIKKTRYAIFLNNHN